MKIRSPYHLPEHKEEQLKRAKRLEWVSVGLMLSTTLIMGLTMGSSQAMYTAWVEDCLSLIPPISFLVAMHFCRRPPNERFPYGYRRSVTIAFLCAALALASFGALLLFNSARALITEEHPTIGMVSLFGYNIWLGWLMIAALAYSAVPPAVLGRMKLPLAEDLHEKVLRTDALMNKADWLTAVAGIMGILGIAAGFWWADAAAAGIISIDVLMDGLKGLKRSVADLMDERPTTVQRDRPDPLFEKLREKIESLDWVYEVEVRLREEGDVFAGEIYVVPKDETDLLEKLHRAAKMANSLHWRIYDVVVIPVQNLLEAHEQNRG